MSGDGTLSDAETLAIFLACGTAIDPMPSHRVELLELWQSKPPSHRVAYVLRAKRLLRTWGKSASVSDPPTTGRDLGRARA